MLRNTPSSGKCTTVFTTWEKRPVVLAFIEARGGTATPSRHNTARLLVDGWHVVLRLLTVADSRRATIAKFHRGDTAVDDGGGCVLARSTTSQPRRRHESSVGVRPSSRLVLGPLLPYRDVLRLTFRYRLEAKGRTKTIVIRKSIKPYRTKNVRIKALSVCKKAVTQPHHMMTPNNVKSITTKTIPIDSVHMTLCVLDPADVRCCSRFVLCRRTDVFRSREHPKSEPMQW